MKGIARKTTPVEQLKQRISDLEAQLRDEALAFKHANEIVEKLEAQLREAKDGWDSCIVDLRKAAEICREAEAQLDPLLWTPITEENPPTVEDEIGSWFDSPIFCVCEYGGTATYEELIADGWTHFRRKNPPAPAKEAASE